MQRKIEVGLSLANNSKLSHLLRPKNFDQNGLEWIFQHLEITETDRDETQTLTEGNSYSKKQRIYGDNKSNDSDSWLNENPDVWPSCSYSSEPKLSKTADAGDTFSF